MSDMLDRIRHELQQRLEATRAVAQEHERVRAALEALEATAKQVTREASKRGRSLAARARPASGGGGSATARPAAKATASRSRALTSGARSEKAATASRARPKAPSAPSTSTGRTEASKSRARAGTTRKQTRHRAPRGANREAVLGVVRDRPGVTARELAAASGVTGGTLYALLRRLIDSGELEKRALPGGQTGYAIDTETGAAPRSTPPDGSSRSTSSGETPRADTGEGGATPARD